MGVTYGIPIASTEDRYIAIAEKALDGMGKAASPGAFLVDLIPIRGPFCVYYTASAHLSFSQTHPVRPLGSE